MPDGTPVEAFYDGFERACSACRGHLRDASLTVGGRGVRLRVVGAHLAGLLDGSFVPGPENPAPALTLDLWDESVSGVGDPGGARPNAVPERWVGVDGERFAIAADGNVVRFSGPAFDVRIDRRAGRGAGWVRSVEDLASWHRARPLQALLLAWLGGQGVVSVHAALVARDGHGVVLAGPSRAGKSTAAAAAATAGMAVLGDDAIAIERVSSGGFAGHCVHAAIKLRQDGLERLPAVAARAVAMEGTWEGEAVLRLPAAFPSAVAESVRIVAIALPRLAGHPDTRPEPVSRGRALAVLTGAALSFEPGAVAGGFALLGEAAERLPVQGLAVGTDPARIPAAIDAVLSDAARA